MYFIYYLSTYSYSMRDARGPHQPIHQPAPVVAGSSKTDAQEAPRRLPGGSQEASRRLPGGSREAPRHPENRNSRRTRSRAKRVNYRCSFFCDFMPKWAPKWGPLFFGNSL